MKRKAIFDTLRRILGRGFRQSEVAAIDDVLDAAMADACSSASAESKSAKQLKPSSTCFELIKRFESCASLRPDGLVEAYPDPGTGGAPWTIGWGATGAGLELGSRIGPGTVWTQKQCDARLADDLRRYAREVAAAIGETPTTQNQFDALVSFHYNTGAIGRATLTKRHVARDYEGAAQEFKRWNKAAGRVLKGLVRRRREEEQLYRKA